MHRPYRDTQEGRGWLRFCVKGLQPKARPGLCRSSLERNLQLLLAEQKGRVTQFAENSQRCVEILAEGFGETCTPRQQEMREFPSGITWGISGSHASP